MAFVVEFLRSSLVVHLALVDVFGFDLFCFDFQSFNYEIIATY